MKEMDLVIKSYTRTNQSLELGDFFNNAELSIHTRGWATSQSLIPLFHEKQKEDGYKMLQCWTMQKIELHLLVHMQKALIGKYGM